MKKILLFLILFFIGGIGYMTIEIIWRGYTHITMGAAGGISLCLMYVVFVGCKYGIVIKSLLCAYCVTCVEFLFGCVVNVWLGMHVWDYSQMFGNLFGQICLLYFFVWAALSIPVLMIFKVVFVKEKVNIPPLT